MEDTARREEWTVNAEVHGRYQRTLADQIAGTWTVILAGTIACLILVGGSMLVGMVSKSTLSDLTRDRASVLGTKVLAGSVSDFGIMLWASGAAIALVGAAAMRRWQGPVELQRFFFAAGLLTAFLCFDDAYMFHESLFPRFLHVPEAITYGLYVIVTGWFLVRFRGVILDSEYLILVVALGLFALSVAADQLSEFSSVETFVEDMFKLSGIIFWDLFFARTLLSRVPRSLPTVPARD